MRVSNHRSTFAALLAVALFAPGAWSQGVPQPARAQHDPRDRIDAADHAERMKRIAIAGDPGLPPLPPVYADSPRDNLLYADRFPYQQAVSAGDGASPACKDGYIPPGPGGTGTSIGEVFEYLAPAGYDPDEEGYDPELPPIPMVIGYHGYSMSADSVEKQSQLDDECYERGWIYFAPTGLDDSLFGSPSCLQNVEVALAWMLANFNIDRDRIYMVGFSMGGGVATNFAARHRDPDGTMIAALGIVSGTFDWTMAWKFGDTNLKNLMQHALNFGGPPTDALSKFGYQKASGLYYNINAYPPLTAQGDLPVQKSSLATNLKTVPTYIVWDTGDTLGLVVHQMPQYNALLQSLGGIVEYHTTTGTLHPIFGTPAPHSWGALDEDALFDFFEGKVADRMPDTFHALLAESGQVSWLSLEQRVLGAFSLVDGRVDEQISLIQLSEVLNALSVQLDVSLPGLLGEEPVHVDAHTSNGFYGLSLTGFDEPPAYLVDAASGDLVLGTESEPLGDTLLHDVFSTAALDALVITDAAWTTDLYTGPNPVALGAPLTLDIDAPPTSSQALLFLGFDEALGTIPGGYHITLSLGPPTLFVALPLDLDGDAAFAATMPSNPVLSGLTMLLQSVAINGSGGGVESISNLWSLHID